MFFFCLRSQFNAGCVVENYSKVFCCRKIGIALLLAKKSIFLVDGENMFTLFCKKRKVVLFFLGKKDAALFEGGNHKNVCFERESTMLAQFDETTKNSVSL